MPWPSLWPRAKLPGLQGEHVVARASEYVPGPQDEQLATPPALDLPAGQSKQLDAPAFEVRPGSHVVQSAEPALENVPAAQGVHRSPSPLLVPAVQLEQVVAPGGEDRPAVQFEHEVAPSPEKVPGSHLRHWSSSAPRYDPGGHDSHWPAPGAAESPGSHGVHSSPASGTPPIENVFDPQALQKNPTKPGPHSSHWLPEKLPKHTHDAFSFAVATHLPLREHEPSSDDLKQDLAFGK